MPRLVRIKPTILEQFEIFGATDRFGAWKTCMTCPSTPLPMRRDETSGYLVLSWVSSRKDVLVSSRIVLSCLGSSRLELSWLVSNLLLYIFFVHLKQIQALNNKISPIPTLTISFCEHILRHLKSHSSLLPHPLSTICFDSLLCRFSK